VQRHAVIVKAAGEPLIGNAGAQRCVRKIDVQRQHGGDVGHVVDVMDAAAGATEDEVVRCLAYLRDERGLKPGTKSGPCSFSWFPVVIGEYFQRQRERPFPPSAIDVQFSKTQFDSMTDAIEI
jgi:hypothetical protein